MDFISLVLDPQSFAQTVENIFAFSFQIKDGWAGLQLGADGQLKASAEERPLPKDMSERQGVFAFTIDDWKQLKEAYGMDKSGLLKHRTEGYEDETRAPAQRQQQPQPQQAHEANAER
jgi:hypothetical protein